MHNIILISSIHSKNGNCDHIELLKILEKIKPDVIFEEKPPSNYNIFYKDKSQSDLESHAINLYLENHTLTQVLVDDEEIPPRSLLENEFNMLRHILKQSEEYRNLSDTYSDSVSKYGFKFLNSIDFLNINRALENEIDKTLKDINKDDLFQTRKSMLEWIEKRDNTMMTNIYNYSKHNLFNTGVFIVGAAHRDSIIRKIPVYNEREGIVLNWDYKNIAI